MRQFVSFVHKEFIHIVRDARTMLILLVMPIVMIILFGYAVTTEVKNTRVAVVDMSHDNLSRRLLEEFDASSYFSITLEETSVTALDELFKRGKIDMAICIPQNFVSDTHKGGSVVQMLFDGIEPNQASIRSGYAQQLVQAFSMQLGGISSEQNRGVQVVTHMLYNPQQKSKYNFVPGVMGMIILLLCTLMTSIAIVREKEQGTMETLLASPLPPICIILAKLVPYFSVSVINLLTILCLSKFLLGIPLAGSIFVFLGISLLYILVALSLGLFISTCVNSQLAAMLLSLLLIVPTVYFSGMVFPTESMPVFAQYISGIVPARWFIDAARKLMIQGVEPVFVARNAAVLALMFVVLISISLKMFKIRL